MTAEVPVPRNPEEKLQENHFMDNSEYGIRFSEVLGKLATEDNPEILSRAARHLRQILHTTVQERIELLKEVAIETGKEWEGVVSFEYEIPDKERGRVDKIVEKVKFGKGSNPHYELSYDDSIFFGSVSVYLGERVTTFSLDGKRRKSAGSTPFDIWSANIEWEQGEVKKIAQAGVLDLNSGLDDENFVAKARRIVRVDFPYAGISSSNTSSSSDS